MLFNKYKKSPSGGNWDNYKKHRNAVTKLKKQSMRHYFFNLVLVYQNPRICGPLSNLFCLGRDLVVDQKSFFQKMIKILSDQRECMIF